MTDYEFMLEDRIAKIRAINEQYDLEHNSYLSFSGGKDSTVLHYLLDLALPGNKIPRVYANTGIEYKMVREYVKRLAETDDRFIILNQTRNIKKTLEEFGYPFKSKEHSLRVEQFNKGKNANYIKKYITGYDFKNGKPSKFVCPKSLKYQFEEKGKYNYSNLCCYKLKKDLMHKWQKENNISIVLTGMRQEEGGNRARLGCTIFEKGKLQKFHPLIVVSEEWEDIFLEKNNIKLCALYYPPFNFKRTGCRGCPFSLDLQKQLDIMKKLLPNEYKQCELLWKPVYDEYRRIGFRLRPKVSDEQDKLYDVDLWEDEKVV
jgi:3'-phosphoadenosine 5'-phosphosulfate sulfotransferase (PAPS reductase)/FAD synthetase